MMNYTVEQVDEYYYDEFAGSPFSKKTIDMYNLFVRIIVSGSFALFGVLSNIINILVFYRQGPMSSSPTVILTALSVSDLLLCVFALVKSVLASIDTFVDYYSNWSWNVAYFDVIITSRPLNLLTQITCWVTTFMAMERAVSVALPFKVRTLFTPKRSLSVVVSIFILTFVVHLSDLLEYSAARDSRPDNSSFMTFDLNNIFPKSLKTVYFYSSPVFLRFTCVFLVLVCNFIIIWKVKSSQEFRKAKWKAENESNSKSESGSRRQDEETATTKDAAAATTTETKEMKLLRMIVVISVVFTVTYCLSVLQTTVLHLVLEYKVDYHWTVEHLTYFGVLAFQIGNSSTNALIYYHMSVRYKEEIYKMCDCCWNGSKENNR